FPGVVGFGYTERVPHARLGDFVRRLAEDPVPQAGRGRFQLVPAGDRPAYCLARLGVTAKGGTMVELGIPGVDLCALSKLLDNAADSGRFSAFVVSSGDAGLFEVIAPVYAGVVGAATAHRPRRR